jgi:Gas vesicle protein
MKDESRQALIADADETLLELVDHVLNKGVVVSGDVMLSIAGVDLVYLRLSALLCAADRIWVSGTKR